MKALLSHENEVQIRVMLKSNWPKGIRPSKRNYSSESVKNYLVDSFCAKKRESVRQVETLCKEIYKATNEVKATNLMIVSFVHLSNNIAGPIMVKKIL